MTVNSPNGHRLPAKPQHTPSSSNYVKIVEVGPRDGLQNEKTIVPTETKLSLINQLATTGLRVIEAGAFVSPRWVPQMADTPDILVHLDKNPPLEATSSTVVARSENSQNNAEDGSSAITYPYLVPNVKGLERAISLLENSSSSNTHLREVAIFASASEGFSQKNINCSVAESLERFRPVMALAKQKDIRVRGYISMVISCPYDGPTPPSAVAEVTKALLDMGCYEISLGDTNGSGTPATVTALLATLLSKPYSIPVSSLACHFHDTFNQALVNAMTALYHGIRIFDSSVAGLGGCPYSKGATGNVSTEDLVYFLEGVGFHTGVDLEKVSEVGEWISVQLGRRNGSKVGPALLARRREEEEKERHREREMRGAGSEASKL
ncbi:hypothetical protein DFH27DRAFT_481673 [Peziza echinospora]|nr:hypothetical protein DFH27DRAFT_481673 [Peziza echinospora]